MDQDKELAGKHKQEKMAGWMELKHIEKWLWVNASTEANTLDGNLRR